MRTKKNSTTTEQPTPITFKPPKVGVPTVRERLARIARRGLIASVAIPEDEPSDITLAACRLIHEINTEVHWLQSALPAEVLDSMAPTEEDRECAARGEIKIYEAKDYPYEF